MQLQNVHVHHVFPLKLHILMLLDLLQCLADVYIYRTHPRRRFCVAMASNKGSSCPMACVFSKGGSSGMYYED